MDRRGNNVTCCSKWSFAWLESHGFEYDHRFFILAIENGHLNVLEWLMEKNLYRIRHFINSKIMAYAAFNCHLRAIQWLRSLNPPCPWDERACFCASSSGHLHVLQWLRSQDPPCPWDANACSNAGHDGKP